MDVKHAVSDIRTALDERLLPTITVWNRLEGRPRRADFDRALKAEVRDALWMLTKQWQIGEFEAEDAGSPVSTKVRMRTAPLTRYEPAGSAAEAFTEDVPLEAKVERRTLRWVVDGHRVHLDLRAELGRQWGRLLDDAGLHAYRDRYRIKYPFELPTPGRASDYVYAHRQAWQQYAALAGRAIDGGELHLYLAEDPGHHASDGIALDAPTDGQKLDDLGKAFEEWLAALYYQPEAEAAWKPPYLEYQFACAGPDRDGEQALAADEYASGHLDWYSFDLRAQGIGATGDPGEVAALSTFLPTPVTFQGMPDARWWALEDRKTDFGSIKPSTTDVAQLLLMEFALVYADDWFLVPFRLPGGTLAHVDGVAVANTFGERFWILPAGTGPEENWHRWSMFELSHEDGPRESTETTLFLAPVVARTIDGDPLEEVELARDEVANMVWAVERTIPSVTGAGRAGKDEARETRAYHERLVGGGGPAEPYRGEVAYLAMTDVPEHFIPLVPVHVPGSIREVQLQRSRMLRIIEGDPQPPVKIPPRTTLMREGLDEAQKKPYFLHEEEVPRAGISVTQSFRRTRWTGGEVPVWLGVRKQTGRGERSSGLAFDTIVPVPPAKG